ncbi:hypothetical protein KC19_3G135400 [Ceratodon purpureus]|uniref:CAAX prenyl protease 2/Lysostaphin resistance protein A-like domain-containing protein n=1 Tax=Ceratodon purpureus TaxID=3225 RepID=A0A8T0IK90_CERPU|nr:hypothetical protein KC19_3G135400 [Ceratodon purpureus]
MELATRSCYGFSHATSSLAPPSTSGRNGAFCSRSGKLGAFSSTSSWRFLPKDSFEVRRPSFVVAAKKYEDPANKPKTPSSADVGKPDANKSLEGQDEISKKSSNTTVTLATREEVLKACRNTSGALAAAGIAIRQGTHWAAEANWPVNDCYINMTYSFELWHLGATAGTVVLIASLRQILLSTWPEFAASSRQSNKQVLSSLQLNDYLVVSFLPGVSEELFFRGAILPLVGVDWSGAAVAGLIFGILHLTGGRNAAFAAWASFVGLVYGLAAVYTTDLAVPMVAHSVANLVAAYVWRIEEDNRMNSK